MSRRAPAKVRVTALAEAQPSLFGESVTAPAPQIEQPAEPEPFEVDLKPGADVLDLLPGLLGHMPLGCALVCRLGLDAELVITTSRTEYQRARAEQLPAFTGAELTAMALAAENDRATARTVAEWLERKRTDAAWRLTPGVALGAVQASQVARRDWSLGRVFLAVGLELAEVRVDDGNERQAA